MLAIVLWPRAPCARAVRGDGRRRRRRRGADRRCSLGTLRRRRGRRARRSRSGRQRQDRQRLDHRRRAASPRRSKLAPARRPSWSPTTGSTKVTEFEVLDGRPHPRRGRERRAGLTGGFSLTLQPGTTRSLPGGRAARTASLTVTGAARRRGARADLQRGVDGYRAYLERETASLVDRRRRSFATRWPGRRRRRRPSALYAAARVPYERDRAGRRELRRPRPARSTRARTTSPRAQVDGLPPDRAGALGRTTRRRARAARRPAAGRRRATLQSLVHDRQARARRRSPTAPRAARRGLEVEDHRRGGALLAHRPVDFEANVDGAQAAFDALAPGARRRATRRSRPRSTQRFAAGRRGAAAVRRTADGFVPYTDADARPTPAQLLSRSIDALAEPLSQVAAQVADAS